MTADLTAAIAATPPAPYYAVIFTSLRRASPEGVDDGYGAMAEAMMALAARQPGYLGVEGAREALGITVSYWASLEAIAAWKQVGEHLVAQKLGRQDWYGAYKTRVCRVERDYGFGDV
jgi:heme-degrading monooxygenase HmoA